MLSLLSAGAITLIVQGILVGSVLGLLYQIRKLTSRSLATEKYLADMYGYVREQVDILESHVTALQTVIYDRTDFEKASAYFHERPNVCPYNGGK